MNITETRNEGLEREYSIVVTAAEIDAKIEAKLAELAQTAKMPGFRPGKVPASVVKARFGDQAKGDVIRTALDDGAKEAIEGNSLRRVVPQHSCCSSFTCLGKKRQKSW